MDDYVPFELSKKLNEKGYSHDYNDFGYRLIYSDECTIKFISNIGAYEREYYGENIPCPTIDEVLDWLRVNKEVDLVIKPSFLYDDNLNRIREYNCSIFAPQLNKPYHTSYHDSYVLNNLISL